MTMTEAEHEVQRCAASLYASNTDWATFYREVLGVRGIVRRLYPTRDAMATFRSTEAYAEIQRMLQRLHAKKDVRVNPDQEPTTVMTVRIPKSLHEALREEAFDHRTSMNRLCISKLLHMIEAEEADEADEADGPKNGGGADL